MPKHYHGRNNWQAGLNKGLLAMVRKTLLKLNNQTLADTSSQETYKWQDCIWEDTPHNMLPRKRRLRWQWATTAHLWEWSKSRTQTTANVGQDSEQKELSFTAARDTKQCSHVRRQFGSFLQNCTYSYHANPGIMVHGIYPKKLKTYGHTNACTCMLIAALLTLA